MNTIIVNYAHEFFHRIKKKFLRFHEKDYKRNFEPTNTKLENLNANTMPKYEEIIGQCKDH